MGSQSGWKIDCGAFGFRVCESTCGFRLSAFAKAPADPP
jgi:hypothetical protein